MNHQQNQTEIYKSSTNKRQTIQETDKESQRHMTADKR
jgi:hypothetical protein